MPQPLTCVPVYASSFPARMRLVDIERSYRIHGWKLVFQGLQLVAVRIH